MSADAEACGDKFLRVGRSARGRRYAALHPSSILFVTPAGSTTKGVAEFETMLKQAGHHSRAVSRNIDLAQLLTTDAYDVLIADYRDIAKIRGDVQPLPRRPLLLPILVDASKAVELEAKDGFACLIRPRVMTKHDALAEIDRAIDLARKTTPSTE